MIKNIIKSQDGSEVFIKTNNSHMYRIKMKYMMQKVEGSEGIQYLTQVKTDDTSNRITQMLMASDKIRKFGLNNINEQSKINEIDLSNRIVQCMEYDPKSQSVFALIEDQEGDEAYLHQFSLDERSFEKKLDTPFKTKN